MNQRNCRLVLFMLGDSVGTMGLSQHEKIIDITNSLLVQPGKAETFSPNYFEAFHAKFRSILDANTKITDKLSKYSTRKRQFK